MRNSEGFCGSTPTTTQHHFWSSPSQYPRVALLTVIQCLSPGGPNWLHSSWSLPTIFLIKYNWCIISYVTGVQYSDFQSVHRISQARILEWVAISSSRESSWPRDWTWVSCIAGTLFTIWATREVELHSVYSYYEILTIFPMLSPCHLFYIFHYIKKKL